jgi:hypothetical protein
MVRGDRMHTANLNRWSIRPLTPAQSDHFDGQRFFNPTGPVLQASTAVPRMLLTRRARWPSYVPVVPRQPPARVTASAVVTLIGHATFLIQTAAGNILTDPVYSKHAGPWNRLWPRRVRPCRDRVRRAAADLDRAPQSQPPWRGR